MPVLDPPDEFDETFRTNVAAILKRVYDNHVTQFDPLAGRGALWFGISVFCHLGPALRDGLSGMPGVQVVPDGIGHVIRVGPHRLWVNKLGRSSDEPVGSSFPRASRRSVWMAAVNLAQLTLDLEGIDEPVAFKPLVELETDLSRSPTQWVIGHFGNGQDGLLAAYICAPLLSDGAAIREWQGWIPIYNNDGDVAVLPTPGLPDPTPPAAPLGEVDVSLRPETQRRNSDAAG